MKSGLTDRFILDLSEDQKVSGFTGCNRVMGSYEISSGNKVQFENLATTRMACPNLDLENKILKLLDSANHFKIENETAYLSRGEGPVLIELRRMEDSDIVNKYWKLKSLGGEPVVMAENQEREQFLCCTEMRLSVDFRAVITSMVSTNWRGKRR